MHFFREEPFVRQALHACPDIRITSRDLFQPLRAKDSRLFFILSAKGAMVINGVSYPLQSNMILLFKAGTPYEWRIEKANYYVLNFDYSYQFSHIRQTFHPLLAHTFRAEDCFDCGKMEDCTPLESPIVISRALPLKHTIQRIVQESAGRDPWRDSLLSVLLKQVLLEILPRYGKGRPMKDPNQKIKQIMGYVQEHYCEALTNADVAAHFGYTPTYLGRLFKQHTGTTLHDYIADLRLTSAMEALHDTGIPIGQICHQAGFRDIYHFSKMFKKKIGVTPSQYRKQQGIEYTHRGL